MKTPLQHFFYHAQRRPNAYFMLQPVDGKKVGLTWGNVELEVRKLASILISKGIKPGDRVALVSKNCAWWIVSDLAIMMTGAVSVPIYPNVNANTVRYILEHSGSKLMLVGKLDDWPTLRGGVPKDLPLIGFPYFETTGTESWNDLMENAEPLTDYNERATEDLLTIIYTSGTTGKPKGVMHSQGNFTYAINAFPKEMEVGGEHARALSYLPMAHIAERALIELGSLQRGSQIFFAESLETFAEDLKFACPTTFGGVPRIWTKLQMGILAKMPQAKLNRLLAIPFLRGIVKKKIQAGLGLHEATTFFTGAAPTPAPLAEWYKKIGIALQEVYGMTENVAYSHFNRPEAIKIGSAGKPLKDVEVKFSEAGEIWMKCPCLMTGYYLEPELTAEVMEDGFFKTGDVGYLDSEGYLFITGRVKEIFKTAKGKYVSPSAIESKLSQHEAIDQVCVTGSSLPQPIALIVQSDQTRSLDSAELKADLNSWLMQVNEKLEKHEKIKKLVFCKEAWAIENGLLTPTLKMKRPKIDTKYSDYFQAWYDQPDNIIFE